MYVVDLTLTRLITGTSFHFEIQKQITINIIKALSQNSIYYT